VGENESEKRKERERESDGGGRWREKARRVDSLIYITNKEDSTFASYDYYPWLQATMDLDQDHGLKIGKIKTKLTDN
jgi:hypothetical protein